MSNDIEITPNPTRPQALTFLCVVSFIGAGLGAVSGLFLYMFHAEVIATINSGAYKDIGFDMTVFSKINRNYFLYTGLLQAVALTGVRGMWVLRSLGFHYYAISQLLMLIVSTIYIYRPSGVFPTFDVIFSSLFILLYFRFKDIMH